jgi:acyl-CoA reductase-like NAD-dependent aldehyde dehydrogenase
MTTRKHAAGAGGALAALVTAEDAQGGATLEVTSPFDGAVLAVLPRSTPEDAERAVARGRTAQGEWARRPVRERAAVIECFGALLIDHRDEMLDWIQLESGKNRASALEEFADTVLWAHHVARHAPGVLRERRRAGAFPVLTHTIERHVPKGVVAVIAPWNYPLSLPIGDALPALAAGNAVVVKPDSQTPDTALFALRLLREAGLPAGAAQIVIGAGRELGPALTGHADFLMFTGSSATGRILAQECAERLIGFSAELGGKNPLLVLGDADPERAAEGAVHAAFSNSGQLCISVERGLVHADVWDRFVPALVERTRALRLAAGTTWDADMGSLAGEAQLRKVAAHVRDAVDKGATVLAGGHPRPDLGPYFFEPTLLADVTPDMRVFSEETFGPLLSLYRVDSDEAAIAAANDSEYGLNASVWSGDVRHARDVARRIRTGTVNINEGYAAAWASHDAPMGGMGDSGIGRRHGTEGLLKYTEAQTIAAQRLIPIAGPSSVSHERWGTALTWGVRALRRLR